MSIRAIVTLLFVFALVPDAQADWPMVAANPQRTSWVADEVRGDIQPVWYRPIEPYINHKNQMIAAEGKIFVSTARGLYGLDADTGALLWVYPTEIPLGDSPTYANGRLYVGSYDRTIHCIDAMSGTKVAGWTPHAALAGFEVNPLVVNGRVYAGNRDGYFYALDAGTGALMWRFKTGAAIRSSAAMDASGVLYFASEDLHAYALAQDGTLRWKSDKLLGDTFSPYWPVVYRNWVIFSAGMGYFYPPPYASGIQLPWDDKADINADLTQNTGKEPGDWAAGTVTMNAAPILQYYESKPYRRRVFMLNRADGREYTFDTDGDGKLEYAPFTFSGITQSGAKYPPVVGSDGVLYTDVDTYAPSTTWTPASALVGWKLGTPYISRVMDWGHKQQQAADEPMAFSMGGKLAYWMLCGDREAGSFDVTIPFGQPNRWWYYWGYNGRFAKFPNYEPMYYGDNMDGWGVYRSADGFYGKHGAQNPWIPYRGKLFRQMGNTIIAAAPNGTATSPLALAATVAVTDSIVAPSTAELRERLEEEIRKMISAGHLKPGLFKSNIGDDTLNGNNPGAGTEGSAMDQGAFYFSQPGDTVYALLRALPHLSPQLQAETRAYIQSEMTNYPIDKYSYVGHVEGSSRQAGAPPPDYAARFAIDKQTTVVNNFPWYFPLTAYYAAWKYAKEWPQEAARLYASMKSKLTVPCRLSDAELLSAVQAHNAYLAGYRGFLELEKLAGQPESASVRGEYERLLALRVNNFSIDLPYDVIWKLRNFIMARHFLYLVPEVAEEIRRVKIVEVQRALEHINTVTPYWFVAGADIAPREGTHQQLYDGAILNGYALLSRAPFAKLVKYLDAPAFAVGDLFFIHNLVAVLEAPDIPTDNTAPSSPRQLRLQ